MVDRDKSNAALNIIVMLFFFFFFLMEHNSKVSIVKNGCEKYYILNNANFN
jgi:hypothetical protein